MVPKIPRAESMLDLLGAISLSLSRFRYHNSHDPCFNVFSMETGVMASVTPYMA